MTMSRTDRRSRWAPSPAPDAATLATYRRDGVAAMLAALLLAAAVLLAGGQLFAKGAIVGGEGVRDGDLITVDTAPGG